MSVELFKFRPVLQTVSYVMSHLHSYSQEQEHATHCHIRMDGWMDGWMGEGGGTPVKCITHTERNNVTVHTGGLTVADCLGSSSKWMNSPEPSFSRSPV
jgi:hypothetical protein